MLKSIRIVIPVVLVCLLSACSSMNSVNTEEQNKKIKTAKINAQLGIAYLERHNLQRAKQKLLLSLEQGPNIPESWYSMAYFLEATGNKDDASIYYQKAISVAPTRGDAQNNYGTFLCRNGDYRGSVEHFMLAVKDPTYLNPADAYENAGLCALKIPDKAMAAKYFAQALRQDPSRAVSERNLRELNKYLAANNPSDEVMQVAAAEPPVAAPDEPAVLPDVTTPPKRIAYNSLKQRHQEEENEDDVDSGLVKVPDPRLASASAQQVLPPVSAQQAVSNKAVYNPAPKAKSKIKTKTMTTQVKTKALAMVNPLTKEKFQVERVALKPVPRKKLAQSMKYKHVKSTRVAAKSHHKHAVVTAKAAKHNHRTLAKRPVPTKNMVTV